MPEETKIRKRCYVFDYDELRYAVVHTSLREAKKWLWADYDVRACCDSEYTQFNPYWLRDVDVSDLTIGDDLVNINGIKKGVYAWIDDICPGCSQMKEIRYEPDWDEICCRECEEKLWQIYIAKKGGSVGE